MNREDIERLKHDTDLVRLIQRDLGPGTTSGRWTRFRCPFHDDNNPSLGVTNGDAGRPAYWKCFAGSCGKSGDVFAWLMEYRDMDFQEAVETLGGTWERDYKPTGKRVVTPKPQQPPDISWQQKAREIMEVTKDNLWSPKSTKAWTWLRNRGLTDSTLKAWDIGYSIGQKIYGIWVPRGIVIPCFSAGQYWYIKVRRPKDDPKYKKISGSRSGLFGADTVYGKDLVYIVEGEFDAMLLYQFVSDSAGVITPGSATDRLDPARWGRILHTVKNIIAVYDNDEAGERGYQNLLELSGRIKRANLPDLNQSKDITDFVQAGGDLERWSDFQLARVGMMA